MTGRIRFDIQEDFGETGADDISDLGHEVGHFFPLFRKQVLLQLRMNRPLRIDLSSLSAHEDAQKLHVPSGLFAWVLTRKMAANWT